MRYLQHILHPGETVLYNGRVHPIIFARGFTLLALASLTLHLFTGIGPEDGPLIEWGRSLAQFYQSPGLYQTAIDWHRFGYNHPTPFKIAGGLLLLFGSISLVKAALLAFFTEIVVTDSRVLVKRGIYNVLTVEIDRMRIAGVTVYQTFTGRLLNYGWVLLQGFAHDVRGLPPLSNPHLLQQQLGRRPAFATG
jgi:hypothetical protein